MPYALNGQVLDYGRPVVVAGVQYPASILTVWAPAELEALGLVWTDAEPEPLTLEDRCLAVDAERDRRLALDYVHDFGAIPAVDHTGQTIPAGERRLQMRPEDRENWTIAQGIALAAIIAGQPDRPLPIRAEDNWNVQTTAAQALGVFLDMAAHGTALLFYGGDLKSRLRAGEDVDIREGWPS